MSDNNMIALRDRSFAPDEPVCVTVCTITFRHRDYIEACIEGFLDQVCPFRAEMVIHDDASDDGTADILRSYALRYPDLIRLILQEENQFSRGVNPYYAFVFPAAQGDYLAICDGDDYWSDPQKLARQVAVLQANPDVALTYGRVRAFNEAGDVPDYVGGATRDLSGEELKISQPINTLTTCFRNIFRGAPPPPFLCQSPIGDMTVWAMLGYHGRGVYLAELAPANYRIHSGGILSLVSEARQQTMTMLAQMNIAAYHASRGDMAAANKNVRAAINSLNRSSLTSRPFIPMGPLNLWSQLRFWNRRRVIARRLKRRQRS